MDELDMTATAVKQKDTACRTMNKVAATQRSWQRAFSCQQTQTGRMAYHHGIKTTFKLLFVAHLGQNDVFSVHGWLVIVDVSHSLSDLWKLQLNFSPPKRTYSAELCSIHGHFCFIHNNGISRWTVHPCIQHRQWPPVSVRRRRTHTTTTNFQHNTVQRRHYRQLHHHE